jgi:hypothetical protein
LPVNPATICQRGIAAVHEFRKDHDIEALEIPVHLRNGEGRWSEHKSNAQTGHGKPPRWCAGDRYLPFIAGAFGNAKAPKHKSLGRTPGQDGNAFVRG